MSDEKPDWLGLYHDTVHTDPGGSRVANGEALAAKDRRIAELERELGSEREARKVAEARAYELEREWLEEARAMVDEADRKTAARISDSCAAKDKRISELEANLEHVCSPQNKAVRIGWLKEKDNRIAELELERDRWFFARLKIAERHRKLREAMAACVDGIGPRSPLGTHGISDGTVCNFCECQPHNCGCVAGVARRALAEDKEQGDGS